MAGMTTNGLITRERLAADLRGMGVKPGDIIYLTARCSEIGNLEPPLHQTLIAGILDAIGPRGTMVTTAFTDLNRRWSKNKAVFTAASPSNCGTLARAALAHPRHIRSRHPSHSFVAIGNDAESILAGHDEDNLAFEPLRKLVEADATMLNLGCNAVSPGFQTVHLAQQDLGLSKRHYTKLLYEGRYVRDDRTVRWRPGEDPGCSRGHDKMYRHYMVDQNFKTGYVGNAYTLMAHAKRAYAVDRAVLSREPRAVLCDDKACTSCRILRGYNLRASLPALARKFWRIARKAAARENAPA